MCARLCHNLRMVQQCLWILYGSETGQSESIAERIFSNSQTLLSPHLDVRLHTLNDIDKHFTLENIHHTVIVCSTTGDGDPPGNAEKFVRKIRRRTLSPQCLAHWSFTLLALGDSNYSNFCNGGKVIRERLLSLGGREFYPTACADDAIGLELVVEPWLEGLWKQLQVCFHISESTAPPHTGAMDTVLVKALHDLDLNKSSPSATADQLLLGDASLELVELTVPRLKEFTFDVEFDNKEALSEEKQKNEITILSTHYPTMADNVIYNSTLVHKQRLTKEGSVKDVYLIDLAIEDPQKTFSFTPGDSVGLIVPNDAHEVDSLLDRIALHHRDQADCPMSFILSPPSLKSLPTHFQSWLGFKGDNNDNGKVPTDHSLRHVITHICDIRQCPSKAALRAWAECCSSPTEQRRMLEFSSKEGQQLYSRFIRESNLSVLDLLLWFPSCRPSVPALLTHLPRLQPRAYSIANSPISSPSVISIAYSHLHFPQSPAHRYSREGVCTGWLTRLGIGAHLHLYKRKNLNGFHLPAQGDAAAAPPLLLVAAGTGVAPFIGFLKHLHEEQQETAALADVQQRSPRQKICLFFGCRERQKDLLFSLDLQHLHSEKIVSHICVAFSRELHLDETPVTALPDCFEHQRHWRYVMDAMTDCREQLRQMICQENAHVMVCGDAKGLAKSVAECLADVLCVEGSEMGNIAMANDYIKIMRKERRYVEDVWT